MHCTSITSVNYIVGRYQIGNGLAKPRQPVWRTHKKSGVVPDHRGPAHLCRATTYIQVTQDLGILSVLRVNGTVSAVQSMKSDGDIENPLLLGLPLEIFKWKHCYCFWNSSCFETIPLSPRPGNWSRFFTPWQTYGGLQAGLYQMLVKLDGTSTSLAAVAQVRHPRMLSSWKRRSRPNAYMLRG